jgi:hypothetical protein
MGVQTTCVVSKGSDNADFGFFKTTFRRLLRPNFHVTPEWFPQLETDEGFAGLAASGRDECAGIRKLEKEIMTLLAEVTVSNGRTS